MFIDDYLEARTRRLLIEERLEKIAMEKEAAPIGMAWNAIKNFGSGLKGIFRMNPTQPISKGLQLSEGWAGAASRVKNIPTVVPTNTPLLNAVKSGDKYKRVMKEKLRLGGGSTAPAAIPAATAPAQPKLFGAFTNNPFTKRIITNAGVGAGVGAVGGVATSGEGEGIVGSAIRGGLLGGAIGGGVGYGRNIMSLKQKGLSLGHAFKNTNAHIGVAAKRFWNGPKILKPPTS